jgi:hypothetical protein
VSEDLCRPANRFSHFAMEIGYPSFRFLGFAIVYQVRFAISRYASASQGLYVTSLISPTIMMLGLRHWHQGVAVAASRGLTPSNFHRPLSLPSPFFSHMSVRPFILLPLSMICLCCPGSCTVRALHVLSQPWPSSSHWRAPSQLA